MIPEWVDRYEFPFVIHTFDSADGRMAYVDEGTGPVLIFIHGNASWSYMYRHLIAGLRDSYRCIAIDHLGFGLSDKPAKADYSPKAHVRRMSEVINHLKIDQATLVAHDFGGPIATAWALANPERTEGFIFFNTWLWSLRENVEANRLFRNFNSLVNRMFYAWLQASPKFFLPVLMNDVHTMPKHVAEQYFFPFNEHRSRSGPYAMARDLVRSSRWFEELWEARGRIEELPMLLLWGENDTLSGPQGMELLGHAFPNSRAVTLGSTNYLAPQDASRRALVEIKGFLRSMGTPTFWPTFLD